MKSFERSLRSVVKPALAEHGFVFDKKRHFYRGEIGSGYGIRFRLTENAHHGEFMVLLYLGEESRALVPLRVDPLSRAVVWLSSGRDFWWAVPFRPGIKRWKVHVEPDLMDASMREVLADLENHWLPLLERKIAGIPEPVPAGLHLAWKKLLLGAAMAFGSLLFGILATWLLLFDCPISAAFAMAGVAVFCPLLLSKRWLWAVRGLATVVCLGLFAAGFGIPVGEVDRKIQRLSAIPRTQGGLSRFTLKDKLGIYGLNLAMGAAAFPLYPEVSRETIWMVRPVPGGVRIFPSEFALGSERVRRMLETFRARMPIEADAPDKKWEGRVAWPLGEYALGQREARYALALNPSRISLWSLRGERHRTIHGEVSVRVEYPASCRVRLLAHPELAVEEGLFWVLQQEGWLHPYTATWTFAVSRDDPRLR